MTKWWGIDKISMKITRYSGEHAFFLKNPKIVKIVAFRGNSGNSCGDGGGDGVLNSNHRGTGRGKTAGDLGERVPRVPRGIPKSEPPLKYSNFFCIGSLCGHHNVCLTGFLLRVYLSSFLLRGFSQMHL